MLAEMRETGAEVTINHHLDSLSLLCTMLLVQVSKCSQWEYDQSEFWDTAVTDNDWVCDKVTCHVSRVARVT